MTRRFRITDAAKAELGEVASDLNGFRRGLGTEFRREFEVTVRMIRRNPRSGAPCRAEGFRWRKVGGTNYLVIYELTDDLIRIVTVFHGRREPDSWMDRPPE